VIDPRSVAEDGTATHARAAWRGDSRLRLAICIAAGLALLIGWSLFFFLTDDAYIAFRYVSNSQLGLGYTWNPPPFRPVEGYTSFLWVVLLDGAWRIFGVEPPVAANYLSLAFSYGTLGLVIAMVLRLRLSPGLARIRTPLLGLVLLGMLTNRTFLAWTSSGLETALFGFLLLAWVYLALFASDRPASLAGLSLTAGLLALARPDGLLFAAVTAGIVVLRLPHTSRRAAVLASGLPLLIPVAHLLWRHATYGYWLPNTYYAKHVAAWPEAGVRYLAAFVLEYAYWVWILLACVVLARATRGQVVALASRLWALEGNAVRTLAVLGALGFQFAYYTFVVGGDLFEFRVYQHLVPLLLVSFPWLTRYAGLGLRGTLAALVAMIMLGWPLPWLHWWHTRALEAHHETLFSHYPVAPHLRVEFRWYAVAWDDLQGWLISRSVGMRHQGHKVFHQHQITVLPTREQGWRLSGDSRPILATYAVGVPGWVLPHVAIIDGHGLNDAVIARNPVATTDSARRLMAHDRGPPEGYPECFRPNVFVTPTGELAVRERPRPLTAEEIVHCETIFLERVLSGR
jgi:arabinofuranosyltransferase